MLYKNKKVVNGKILFFFFSENSILTNPRDSQRNVIRNTFIFIYLAHSTFWGIEKLSKGIEFFCHKLWCFNPYISATRCRRTLMFLTKNSYRSTSPSLKYQRCTLIDQLVQVWNIKGVQCTLIDQLVQVWNIKGVH